MVHSRRLLGFSFALAVLLSQGLLSFGCKSQELPDNEIDKARMITQLRKEARKHLDDFRRNPENIEPLLAYLRAHEKPTKIGLDSCPECFAEYGAALSRVGLYYEGVAADFRAEHLAASGADRAALLTKANTYRDMALDHYRRSNREFEVYFAGAFVDPGVYVWVFRQSAALGDFDKALYFLKRYEESVTLAADDRDTFEVLKKRYERGRRDQREFELREELRGEEEQRLPGPQPAN